MSPPAAPLAAWPEEARLLPAPAPAPVHAPRRATRLLGLSLVVWPHNESTAKYLPALEANQPLGKTKTQKRKEKLYAVLKPPYFLLSMITILVVVQAALPASSRALLEWSPEEWCWQPWRLVSYSLVHASRGHLALNALVALAVGWSLEREQGWRRVLGAWAAGAAAGALAAGALQPHMRVLGASGAVYALLTAHLPNVALRFGHIPLWWFRPLSVSVLALSELSWSLLRALSAAAGEALSAAGEDPPAPCVAWAAHLFGALVGVPVGFLLFTGEQANRPYVYWCRVASGAALAALGLVAAAYYTGFLTYPLE